MSDTTGRCAACDWTTHGPTIDTVSDALDHHYRATHLGGPCEAPGCGHDATDRGRCGVHAAQLRAWVQSGGGRRG